MLYDEMCPSHANITFIVGIRGRISSDKIDKTLIEGT